MIEGLGEVANQLLAAILIGWSLNIIGFFLMFCLVVYIMTDNETAVRIWSAKRRFDLEYIKGKNKNLYLVPFYSFYCAIYVLGFWIFFTGGNMEQRLHQLLDKAVEQTKDRERW